MFRYYQLTIITVFISGILIAQKGPGGVGVVSPSSHLVLWLKADGISVANGTTVTTWQDNSGYGNHFNNGNGAVFSTPSVNGYPSFSFNGTSNYFEKAYTPSITPSSYTVFSANQVLSSSLYKTVISNRDGSPQRGFMLYSRPTTNNWDFWTGTGSGWATTAGVSTAGAWATQMFTFEGSSSSKQLGVNGTIVASLTGAMSPNTVQSCRVGAGRNENTPPDYYFYGNIGEVIMYNSVLNEAQIILVNNYLAAKYGFLLGTNDLYDEDNASSGNYDHDVAGIGRINNSNIHSSAQGSGIVGVSNPSHLDDGEFFIWGHDNGISQATNLTDVPYPVEGRFQRVWRVSEVNTSKVTADVGAIDISFDLTGLGYVDPTQLRLLVDTDNDGVFIDETPISGAVSVGANVYVFYGVTAIQDNFRFTLGTTDKVVTPLPIELVNFEVQKISNRLVDLSWQTVSEQNSDYCIIERSVDGIEWSGIGELKMAGYSKDVLNYFFEDKNPFNGTSYYRLKLIDYDGSHHFSETKSISINIEEIDVFPNPVDKILRINGGENVLRQISVVDVVGESVIEKVSIDWETNTLVLLDVSNLKRGVYYLRCGDLIHKFVKE